MVPGTLRILTLLAATLPSLAAAAPTVLQCGRLIDGRAAEVGQDVIVVVRGERIEAVGGGVPAGADVIDLSDSTCLPGLIDAHAHVLILEDDYQIDHLRKSSGYKALRGLHVLQQMLHAGWTTVRIAGDADVYYAHLDARAAIQEGLFVGPRVTGAGHYLSITGGGGDLNQLGPEHQLLADGRVVDGVDAIRQAVREEVKYGSDWIKVLASGAFMSAGDDPTQVHFSREEMDALVAEANRLGVPVMAHAHSAAAIVQAVEAGVRSIEHGTFIDDDGIRAMKRHGTYLVPTVYIGEYFLEDVPDTGALSKAVELTRRYREQYLASLARAIDAGVKVGVGTDHVGFPVHYGVREIAMMTTVGMTPMQAVQAATRVNAELLGWDDRLGTVEAGKLADIIAVPGDLLADLSRLEQVEFVMRGGQVVRKE